MTRVLLTRTYENNELLSEKLNLLGYQTISHPLLTHYLTYNLNIDSELFSENKVIIITSNFAAKQISNISLKCKGILVVGNHSAQILKNAGYNIINIFESSRDLYKSIDYQFDNYIYLRGEIVTEDFDKIKNQIIIYKTEYINKVTNSLISDIHNSDILTFFSKETVNSLLSISDSKLLNLIKEKQIYCFSKKIAELFNSVTKYNKIKYCNVANIDQFLTLF